MIFCSRILSYKTIFYTIKTPHCKSTTLKRYYFWEVQNLQGSSVSNPAFQFLTQSDQKKFALDIDTKKQMQWYGTN